MAKQTTVEIDTKVLDGILKKLDGNISDAVAKAAFSIEGRAKIKAPVDTGALRASIYTAMKGTSKEPGRYSGVAYNDLPVPRDKHVAHVGPSVEYAAGIELGTARRPGTPYLQPAVREVEREFRELLKKAVNNER